MQFTRRQLQRAGGLMMLWALISALVAIAGPFGTHDTMGLVARIGYWAVVVAVSIAGSLVVAQIKSQRQVVRLAAWAVYVVVLALGVLAFNAALFGLPFGLGELASLVVIVGLSVLAINGLLYLAQQMMGTAAREPELPANPQARFLRRLPIELRAPLVRFEAQDHYLNVTTSKGKAMILLRMAEAVEELKEAGGLQVHRSHWVALDAVQGHVRVEGRDLLKMPDGVSVPVARTRRDAARAAGLF